MNRKNAFGIGAYTVFLKKRFDIYGENKISIRQWLLGMMGFYLALIAAAIFIGVWYVGGQVRKQTIESSEKLSELYLEFLDSSVAGIDVALSQFAANTMDVSVLAMSENDLELYLAKRNILQKLKEDSLIYNIFDGIFVSIKGRKEDTFLCQAGALGNTRQIEHVQEIVKSYGETYSADYWELVRYGGECYLMRVIENGSVNCGAWIHADSISMPLESSFNGETGSVLFLDKDGRLLSGINSETAGFGLPISHKNGEIVKLHNTSYLQMTVPSRILPIQAVTLIPEKACLHPVYTVQKAIMVLLLVLGMILLILWKILSKAISEPVGGLIDSMVRVENGNMKNDVLSDSFFKEFTLINRYFMHMVSELERLKRDVYERQIREQKIRLQYLETQIRPHFFLNTLNVIYSFSLVGQNTQIEKMVICLSKYLGYLFKNMDSLVTLREEQEHIENYMEIQKLRYKNQFDFLFEREEALADAKLPPLILQTFAENSLKYGMVSGEPFLLEILAHVIVWDKVQKLQIMITDHGPGYGQEILSAVREQRQPEGAHGHGIGIFNAAERLRLIYGGDAYLELLNRPEGGACALLTLPLEF